MASRDRFSRTIVRCSGGALYSTIWVPLMSFKSIRLGNARIQRCPVHHKWERVMRVDPATLTAEEVAEASRVTDGGIP
jgi:hypothetical protein